MRHGLLAAAIAMTATTAEAAVIFQESFEAPPGTTYTLSDPFDDGGADYFGRYAVPDLSNVARDDFLVGWHDDYGIMGQDHDGAGGAATRSVVLGGIDIAGFTGLSVTAAFGALDSEPGFYNFEAAEGDGIKLFASIDAAPRVLLGAFAPPVSGAGSLRLDTDADSVGDGAILTTALTDFAFDMLATGGLLTLEFELTSTNSFESLAMDNVRVSGNSLTADVPIPAPALLLGTAMAGLLGFRARRRVRA